MAGTRKRKKKNPPTARREQSGNRSPTTALISASISRSTMGSFSTDFSIAFTNAMDMRCIFSLFISSTFSSNSSLETSGRSLKCMMALSLSPSGILEVFNSYPLESSIISMTKGPRVCCKYSSPCKVSVIRTALVAIELVRNKVDSYIKRNKEYFVNTNWR